MTSAGITSPDLLALLTSLVAGVRGLSLYTSQTCKALEEERQGRGNSQAPCRPSSVSWSESSRRWGCRWRAELLGHGKGSGFNSENNDQPKKDVLKLVNCGEYSSSANILSISTDKIHQAGRFLYNHWRKWVRNHVFLTLTPYHPSSLNS